MTDTEDDEKAGKLDPELCAFLAAGPDGPAEVIETHAAMVFLRGREALKVKKPVRFPYLDFSTREKRAAAIAREYELNAPHAPQIYRGVSKVVRRKKRGFAYDAEGEAVETVLRMTRFAQSDVLEARAQAGALTRADMVALARMMRASHFDAPIVRNVDAAAALHAICQDNLKRLAAPGAALDEALTDSLHTRSEAAFAACEAVLRARAPAGWVRRCHGDAHLGNMVMLDGEPVLFDALEFDEALATTDIFYDLAFALMDILRLAGRARANEAFNAYVELTDITELEGLCALGFLASVRAGVRAKVAVDRAAQGARRHAALLARVYQHAELAETLLEPFAPRLIGVGGLSGSGKSSVAAAMAPQLPGPFGAVIIRSDVERKMMAGVDPEERLAPEAYDETSSARVYARIRERAASAFAAGQTVIVDAVHAREEERAALSQLALEIAAPFSGLWLDCPLAVRQARVGARRGDASDATAEVAAAQEDYERGAMDWTVLSAEPSVDDIARAALGALDASD